MPHQKKKNNNELKIETHMLTENSANPVSENEQDFKNTLPLVPQLSIAIGILITLFGLSYLPLFSDPKATEPAPLETRIIDAIEEREHKDIFADVTVSAHAAYVWDVKNQKALYNKNASAQLPLASLTKLMTALVAEEHLDHNDPVVVTHEAIAQEGESGFEDGKIFTFRDLADFTLMTSSNDGAYALAAAVGKALAGNTLRSGTEVFLEAMNKKAEDIGLLQTYFTNPTGLDTNEIESGSYGSARDMAFLMEHIITAAPSIFERTNEGLRTVTDTSGAVYVAENTSPITRDIPGLIASKTGYTDLAGGNLVVAFDAGFNHPIIVSVLGSTRDGRFSDVLTLVERARTATAK